MAIFPPPHPFLLSICTAPSAPASWSVTTARCHTRGNLSLHWDGDHQCCTPRPVPARLRNFHKETGEGCLGWAGVKMSEQPRQSLRATIAIKQQSNLFIAWPEHPFPSLLCPGPSHTSSDPAFSSPTSPPVQHSTSARNQLNKPQSCCRDEKFQNIFCKWKPVCAFTPREELLPLSSPFLVAWL